MQQNALVPLTFLLACIVYSLPYSPVLGDADVSWHIATGDLIRRQGSLPMRDVFSYNTGDNLWYNFSWLPDLLFSYVNSLGGFSLLAFIAVVCTAYSASLVARICLKNSSDPIPAVLLSILAILVLWNGVTARPQLVTFILVPWFYLLMRSFREFPCLRHYWLFPLLMLLWVNCHGGFVIGFTIIGAFLLEAVMEGRHRQMRQMSVIMLLIIIASLINPYGYKLYYGIYINMTGLATKYVTEWNPLRFPLYWEMSLLLVLALTCSRFLSPKIPLAEKTLAFCWLLLALKHIRYANIAILLAAPFLVMSIREIAEQRKWCLYEVVSNKSKIILSSVSTIKYVSLIAACFAALLAIPKFQEFIRGEPVSIPEAMAPVDSLDFILGNYSNLKFFNDYNYGGYIIFKTQGKLPVFIDGRASAVYSNEIVADYGAVTFARSPDWRDILDKHGIDGVIMGKDFLLVSFLGSDPDWRLVFEGKKSAVFIRADKLYRYRLKS